MLAATLVNDIQCIHTFSPGAVPFGDLGNDYLVNDYKGGIFCASLELLAERLVSFQIEGSFVFLWRVFVKTGRFTGSAAHPGTETHPMAIFSGMTWGCRPCVLYALAM